MKTSVDANSMVMYGETRRVNKRKGAPKSSLSSISSYGYLYGLLYENSGVEVLDTLGLCSRIKYRKTITFCSQVFKRTVQKWVFTRETLPHTVSQRYTGGAMYFLKLLRKLCYVKTEAICSDFSDKIGWFKNLLTPWNSTARNLKYTFTHKTHFYMP